MTEYRFLIFSGDFRFMNSDCATELMTMAKSQATDLTAQGFEPFEKLVDGRVWVWRRVSDAQTPAT